MGSPLEFDTFLSAVIDEKAFNRIVSYVEYAKASEDLTIVSGGKYDKRYNGDLMCLTANKQTKLDYLTIGFIILIFSKGFFIEPTLVQTNNPTNKIMKEEIFGPITTAYVYADKDIHKTLELVNTTTAFGLTGGIFALDRYGESQMLDVLT